MITQDKPERLNKRDAILDHIFIHGTENSLRELINMLNKDSEITSLWFCGSRIDHMRCLGSEEIGWGISALPNDFDKAKMPKYHPHQVEIMVPIYGSVIIETYHPGAGIKQIEIQQGKSDYHIIKRKFAIE